jgi:hypothetical protein
MFACIPHSEKKPRMTYLVIHNGEQSGPFVADEIKARIEAGELDWTDQCWREGWTQWRPIGSVAALAPAEAFAKAPENPEASLDEHDDRLTRRRHAGHGWTIGLAILLIVALSGVAVLWVLLSEARARIESLEAAGPGRALVERALATRIHEVRAPVPADEIKVWMTYLDPASNRPVPVSRGNVLLYPAESVAAALEALRKRPPGPVDSLMEAVQGALPPPQRETITDSEGFAEFAGIPPGKHVIVAFTMKPTDTGERPYLWIAELPLDGHPHPPLVLSESNAADSTSGLVILGSEKPPAP